MNDVVVDSCVLAKWVLAETDSGQAVRLFTDVVGGDRRLFAVDIALAEAMNAIWVRYH